MVQTPTSTGRLQGRDLSLSTSRPARGIADLLDLGYNRLIRRDNGCSISGYTCPASGFDFIGLNADVDARGERPRDLECPIIVRSGHVRAAFGNFFDLSATAELRYVFPLQPIRNRARQNGFTNHETVAAFFGLEVLLVPLDDLVSTRIVDNIRADIFHDYVDRDFLI